MKKTSKISKTSHGYNQIVNFIYETNIHSKTPRSGLWFVGSGEQSVAEHLFHTAMIAYVLSYLDEKVDKNKVILMALFHDIGEGRTSDHNYVHQRYGRLAEADAVNDIAKSMPFGKEIAVLFAEEQERITPEARLVKDADTLEWISTLRMEEIKGNLKAGKLIKVAVKRLMTINGKKIGYFLLKTNPDSWWFDSNDKWFINHESKYKKRADKS